MKTECVDVVDEFKLAGWLACGHVCRLVEVEEVSKCHCNFGCICRVHSTHKRNLFMLTIYTAMYGTICNDKLPLAIYTNVLSWGIAPALTITLLNIVHI